MRYRRAIAESVSPVEENASHLSLLLGKRKTFALIYREALTLI